MKIPVTYFLPITLIVLDVGAAIVYFISGDWKKGCYWLSAACITLFVTI